MYHMEPYFEMNREDRPDLPKKHKRKKKAHASTTEFECTKNLQIGNKQKN
jgi:hypothetical protein